MHRKALGILAWHNARYANNTCKFGGGGLSGSPKDVVFFNQPPLHKKFIKEKTLEMVFISMTRNNGEKTRHGSGLEFDTTTNDCDYAWHSGRGQGGRNPLVIYPEEE